MKTAISTRELSLFKIKQYCDYQQRCNAEVREKLNSFNLNKKETEEIILQLIQLNYLNEEEFAIQFARGKFRINQWGRVKIKYALKQKRVSNNFIRKALDQIAENDYKATLTKLAQQKVKLLKNEISVFKKNQKLYDYLLQKGYERNLIKEVVDKS